MMRSMISQHATLLDEWFSDDKPVKTPKEVVEDTVEKITISFPPDEQAARDQFIKLVHLYISTAPSSQRS